MIGLEKVNAEIEKVVTKAYEKGKAESPYNFSEEELNEIKYALEYLHDADLSEYGEDNIITLEKVMKKLGMDFTSQL